jgi:hypothetical protein
LALKGIGQKQENSEPNKLEKFERAQAVTTHHDAVT